MKDLKEFGLRIRNRRIELNMTQEELARASGYTSRSSINKIESGLVDLPQSKVEAIANALGTPAAALLGLTIHEIVSNPDEILNIGTIIKNISPISVQRVPMLGKIACGKPIYADENRESYVQAGTNIGADFCLTACGDSMINARIHDGDLVFCRRQDIVENGEIGVIIIGDEATLKRVFYYPEKKKLVLQAENPKYEPLVYVNDELDEIHIIGKAIAFQSDVK